MQSELRDYNNNTNTNTNNTNTNTTTTTTNNNNNNKKKKKKKKKKNRPAVLTPNDQNMSLCSAIKIRRKSLYLLSNVEYGFTYYHSYCLVNKWNIQ